MICVTEPKKMRRKYAAHLTEQSVFLFICIRMVSHMVNGSQ